MMRSEEAACTFVGCAFRRRRSSSFDPSFDLVAGWPPSASAYCHSTKEGMYIAVAAGLAAER